MQCDWRCNVLDEIKEFLVKRISHAEKRFNQIQQEHGDNPSETHTYWGGKNLGLWRGTLSAYEVVLDEIKAIEKRKTD